MTIWTSTLVKNTTCHEGSLDALDHGNPWVPPEGIRLSKLAKPIKVPGWWFTTNLGSEFDITLNMYRVDFVDDPHLDECFVPKRVGVHANTPPRPYLTFKQWYRVSETIFELIRAQESLTSALFATWYLPPGKKPYTAGGVLGMSSLTPAVFSHLNRAMLADLREVSF